MIKVGDTVIPKKHPSLKGVVKNISKAYDGSALYILDNGCMYTEEEVNIKTTKP